MFNLVNRHNKNVHRAHLHKKKRNAQRCKKPFPLSGIKYCMECVDKSQVNLHEASTILISCMDFRLRDNICCYMDNLGYKNKYDEIILAGASLGYNGVNGAYLNWVETADDHIKLSYQLHDIKSIILIDHMQCGGYKLGYPDLVGQMGSVNEYNYHVTNLKKAAISLFNKYGPDGSIIKIPDLTIKKYIISIDGGELVDIDIYGVFPF